LSKAGDLDAFEGKAVVFDGREDYSKRIDDPSLEIDENTMLFMRGAGPIGHPGAAEVVNMQPPAALIKRGITSLPCIGDGRQSGTSGSPSILNASPEAASGGGLAILKTGDRVRIEERAQAAHAVLHPTPRVRNVRQRQPSVCPAPVWNVPCTTSIPTPSPTAPACERSRASRAPGPPTR
jgi:dihydroxyacid dehydratase/phosphogluconate dehydratase